MSRKDYILIAQAIARLRAFSAPSLDTVVSELCGVFQADNPRFSAQRFIDACKGTKNEQRA